MQQDAGYQSVAASTICGLQGNSISARDVSRINKLIRKGRTTIGQNLETGSQEVTEETALYHARPISQHSSQTEKGGA